MSWGTLRAHVAKGLCFAWWLWKAFFNQGNCVWWSWSFLFASPFASLPDTLSLLTFCCLLGRNWDYFGVTLIISYPIFHLQNCSVSVSDSLLPTWCSANCLIRLRGSFAGVGEISKVRRWHKRQFLMTRHGGVMYVCSPLLFFRAPAIVGIISVTSDSG